MLFYMYQVLALCKVILFFSCIFSSLLWKTFSLSTQYLKITNCCCTCRGSDREVQDVVHVGEGDGGEASRHRVWPHQAGLRHERAHSLRQRGNWQIVSNSFGHIWLIAKFWLCFMCLWIVKGGSKTIKRQVVSACLKLSGLKRQIHWSQDKIKI